MKKSLFFLCLITAQLAFGQNVEINSQAFPKIQLRVVSEKSLSKENVKLSQKGQNIDFQLVKQEIPSNEQSQGKSVYFLIETSGFTNVGVVNNFKTGINDFLRKAPEGVYFNGSSFWKANAESKILNNLSVDFTTKKDAFAEEIKQKIKPVVDSQQQADVHKAIYDAIEYIGKTATTPQKQLIVLTAGVNKSYSPIKIEDCAEKASQTGVQVFSLVYKTGYAYALDNLKKLADKTQAKSQLVSNSQEITNAIEDFVKIEAEKPSAASNNYEITFTVPNSTDVEGISISIDGQTQNLNITAPQTQNENKESNENTSESKGNNSLLFIVLAVVVLGGIGFWFYQKQQKEKAQHQAEQEALKAQLAQQQQQFQQEQQRLQQQILQQQSKPTEIKEEPKKFDPKKTYIGGGGGTPTLSVSGQGFQQNFMLHKPTMTIGRKEGNDIVIPIETVSGSHAILSNEGGNWFISDNNSTNGVILNGNRVQKHILKQGDKIQLGGALLVFQL
jgi:hypothetical protein